MEKQRVFESVKGLWEEWEIHCLILLSLLLQVFLFLAAGMRKHSSGWVLRTVLWLAYLSADSVAVFVLGHLAVRMRGPSHHLMFFWAPFVLVHLGGQDTITAFSKEDNDLWNRHLLNLAIQAAVAGYVVAKASWPDGRLRAAMVLMFLSGCFKYAERTICFFASSPAWLRSLSILTFYLAEAEEIIESGLREFNNFAALPTRTTRQIGTLHKMKSSWSWIGVEGIKAFVLDIMSTDAPLRVLRTTEVENNPPDMPEPKFCGWAAYEFVGASLEHCYQYLYTKNPVRRTFYAVFESTFSLGKSTLCLLFTLFQYVATPIALVLFTAAKKGDHTTIRADIIVSYILLVGAIVLDISSAAVFIFSIVPEDRIIKRATLRLANYIQPACCRKQWSQELAQYSMMKRQDMALVWQRIREKLSFLGVELFDVTHVPLSEGIKEFILEELVGCRTRKEWNKIASSRGQLALQQWQMDNVQVVADSDSSIHRSVGGSVDFPASVLIWHIATDMCYYWKDQGHTNSSCDKAKRHKEMSRELSSYIMYLVFKCGVMLTNESQLEHDRTRGNIGSTLPQAKLCEKEAVMELRQRIAGIEDRSPVHHAHKVALELMSIDDETQRWGLITSVWSEMLYYTVPRCGAAFHYMHLATGGEFATHVLLLMKFLGA
ncbi:hypothetical protein PVAP13_7KG022900 [Panicum virgatum]|uniref:DUF4220 domain-containing protein n=2 Tax=Panicum virgatum TaxID=38727 RepID=A0A8T0Q8E6_PANVG|nr:hypothetical protein PVAP13_7KG022900 [Panicum virgatum]